MNIYELITARMCASLEHGVAPWHRPWSGGELPKNLYSQHPYRGVNVWLLATQPYASPYWATFRQIQAIGGRIRRDEHGTPVVFWKVAEPNVEPDVSSTQPETKQAPLLRYYTVWNSEQCELPSSLTAKLHESLHIPFDPIPACEQIVRQMPRLPVLIHGGNQAVYSPRDDRIRMPFPVRFARPENYYATLYHELCHAAGHVSRLGRPSLQTPCPFGSAPYGQEELVAEMGAAFVCGVAGIAPAILDNTRVSPVLAAPTPGTSSSVADYGSPGPESRRLYPREDCHHFPLDKRGTAHDTVCLPLSTSPSTHRLSVTRGDMGHQDSSPSVRARALADIGDII